MSASDAKWLVFNPDLSFGEFVGVFWVFIALVAFIGWLVWMTYKDVRYNRAQETAPWLIWLSVSLVAFGIYYWAGVTGNVAAVVAAFTPPVLLFVFLCLWAAYDWLKQPVWAPVLKVFGVVVGVVAVYIGFTYLFWNLLWEAT